MQAIKINATKAKVLYNYGFRIELLPCKLGYTNCWNTPYSTSKHCNDNLSFEEVVNMYTGYNCNNKVGTYASYFIDIEENKGILQNLSSVLNVLKVSLQKLDEDIILQEKKEDTEIMKLYYTNTHSMYDTRKSIKKDIAEIKKILGYLDIVE